MPARTRECRYCATEFEYDQGIGCGPMFCSIACRRAREKDTKSKKPQCIRPDCTNKAMYDDGICNACYCRRRRTGTLERRVFTYRAHWASGYIALTNVKNHPLANKDGCVYEHRYVLFEAIGPGPHQCHWCSASVDWIKGKCLKGSLVPDHLDGNKHNNALSNLVPACNRCNATRGLFMAWVREHSDDPVLWQMYQRSQKRTA